MKIVDLTRDLLPSRPYVFIKPEEIKRIVFHHTASPKSMTPYEIYVDHKSRGWNGVGYHYLIRSNGVIYKTRPILAIPACVERRNTGSICIAWIGHYNKYDVSQSAFYAALELTEALLDHYGKLAIHAHRELAQTGCPGRYGYEAVKKIREIVKGV